MDNSKYEGFYSEQGLWDKLKDCAKKLGKGTVENTLKLYYAIALGKASPEQLVVILGALGYLISPVDTVPDMLPGGLVDDAGVLTAAVGLLACCSDDDVIEAAKAKTKEWFD